MVDRDVRAEPGNAPLVWDGRLGDLAMIALGNAALILLTLGIYRFWARVRIRRYVWSHLKLFGDRLEYTGTGGELAIGFLKALGFLLMVVVFAAVLAGIAAAIANANLAASVGSVVNGVLAVLFAILAMLGLFAALRYRASRTLWRGIRMRLRGSSWGYAFGQFGWLLLAIPTLTLANPFGTAAHYRRLLGGLSLGTCDFSFDGRGARLLGAWVLSLFLGVLLAAAVAGGFAASGAFEPPTGTGSMEEQVQFLWPLIPISIVGIIAISMFYQAFILRWAAEHTQLAGAHFSMPGATTPRVLWLLLGNALLVLLSLGLLAPLATARMVGFLATHLVADRVPALDAAGQVATGPRSGEGLADYFGESAFSA